MITQISDDLFRIKCDICGTEIAYFYFECTPEEAVKQDEWYVDKDTVHCMVCFEPPEDQVDYDKWSLNDLFYIVPEGRAFYTKNGMIDWIRNNLVIVEGEDHDRLVEKYNGAE